MRFRVRLPGGLKQALLGNLSHRIVTVAGPNERVKAGLCILTTGALNSRLLECDKMRFDSSRLPTGVSTTDFKSVSSSAHRMAVYTLL